MAAGNPDSRKAMAFIGSGGVSSGVARKVGVLLCVEKVNYHDS